MVNDRLWKQRWWNNRMGINWLLCATTVPFHLQVSMGSMGNYGNNQNSLLLLSTQCLSIFSSSPFVIPRIQQFSTERCVLNTTNTQV